MKEQRITMETDRWLRIKEIFNKASGLPPDRRAAFLDEACRGEEALRREIEALLKADSHADEFMETPPAAEVSDEEEGASLIGAQIGQYTLERILSTGGMGTVYEALQETPRRTVAVKVMRSGLTTRSAQRRFEYEAEILAHLRHPHIAQVIEAGTHEGVPYFVMELIPEALSITTFAEKKNLDTRARLELYLQVCDAVNHGHQKGIIHRDLKPSNILVDAAGQVKIIDFGVARATDSDVSLTTVRTEVGQLIGTLQYMSPEQCKADPADLDTRSDVYALGVVLYELLCDELPYDVEKIAVFEAARLISEAPPKRPSTLNRALRGDVETIVLKALEKERDERYASVADFAEDLERYLNGEVILAKPTGPLVRFWKGVKRNPVVSGSIAAGFIALLASFLYVVLVAYPQIRLERDKAEAAALSAKEERDRAARAAEIAQATNDFLDEMLASPDPYHQGKDVTMVEVLDLAAAKLGTAYPDMPEVEAQLRGTLGSTYFFSGEYGKAEEQLLYAVELIERFAGKNSLLAHKANGVLASVYTSQGRLDEAEALLTHALEDSRRQAGEVHPVTSLIMKFMADLVSERGRLAEAEELYERVVEVHIELYGEAHPDTLATINNLARVKRDRGKTEEAFALQRNILEIRRRTLGEEHLQTLFTMTSMSNTLLFLKRNEEADELSQKAFESISRLLGDRHPFTLTVMNNRADMLERQHHLDEAEAIFRELLKIRSKLLGERHPDTLLVKHNIADVLWKKGKLQEAEILHRETLAARIETLGEDHPDTLHSKSGLGKVLHSQGRLAEAETVLREVLEARIRVLGEDHRITHNTYHQVARVLADRGKIAEAMQITRTLLERQNARLGEAHASTMTTAENLAILLDRSGRPAEAEALFLRLLEIRRGVLGEAHVETLKAMHNLVIFYERHGDVAQMEALGRELFDLWKEHHDPEHVDTMKAMNHVVRALMHRERYEDAVPLLEHGMEIMDRLWKTHGIRGLFHLEYGECLIRLGRLKEAEEHLKQGLEQWTELFGEGHWRLDKPVNLLIELYEEWGKIGEADQWRARLVNPSDA
jgi:non-specific serine/threonine protein kinase/serine/threonine-protein kinase